MKSNDIDEQTFVKSMETLRDEISPERQMLELQISTINHLLDQNTYTYNMDDLVIKIRDVSKEYLEDFTFLDSVA